MIVLKLIIMKIPEPAVIKNKKGRPSEQKRNERKLLLFLKRIRKKDGKQPDKHS